MVLGDMLNGALRGNPQAAPLARVEGLEPTNAQNQRIRSRIGRSINQGAAFIVRGNGRSTSMRIAAVPTHAAGIAEISFNHSNGEIKVHNFWCTIDCGVAVCSPTTWWRRPRAASSLPRRALTELITVKNGIVEQNNFYDYHVPRMKDVPAMHIEVIQTDIIRPAPARWRRR
jgi:CO/xanthine dehydrogenase Mo-binding subunit